MSDITEEDVKHLAALARIELKPEEVPRLQKDLVKILDYVEALKGVNTDGLPEISQVTGLTNVLREDAPRESFEGDAEIHKRLLEAFPIQEKGYLKVKAVFADTDDD